MNESGSTIRLQMPTSSDRFLNNEQQIFTPRVETDLTTRRLQFPSMNDQLLNRMQNALPVIEMRKPINEQPQKNINNHQMNVAFDSREYNPQKAVDTNESIRVQAPIVEQILPNQPFDSKRVRNENNASDIESNNISTTFVWH